jgi:hypothetical protein
LQSDARLGGATDIAVLVYVSNLMESGLR